MEAKINLKDRKLLSQLEQNSRQSNIKIAKQIGTSKDSVAYKIKKLIDIRIIKEFSSVTNPSKLGYTSHRILLKLIDTDTKKFDSIIKHLKQNKQIWWISKLDGAWDMVFATWTKSNTELQEILADLNLKFKPQIGEQQICPVIKYELSSRGHLTNAPSKKLFTIGGEPTAEKIDETDKKILEELSKNSKIPLIDLAEILKIDNMTIHHRIKKLEEKQIILGYTIHLNTRKLMKVFYSVKINLKQTTQKQELIEYIQKLPQITATTETIGGYDIDFDIEVENSEEYFQIIERIRDKFPLIRNIIYFRILENYKILRIPRLS